jgi:hypothetical protein
MLKKTLYILCCLCALHFGKLIYDAGLFYDVTELNSENCYPIAQITGAEDIELAGEGAYISSNDFRKLYHVKDYPNGALHFFNLNTKQVSLVKHDYKKPFHPHGIKYFSDGSGQYLFVINHGVDRDSVIVFKILADQRLKVIEEYHSPLLRNGNDIAVVSLKRFFVTIDHYYRSEALKKIEDYSRVPLGQVLQFSEGAWSVYLSGFNFTNGITWDEQSRSLVVAGMTQKKLFHYELNSQFEPSLKRSYSLEGAPDNVTFLKGTGVVLVAIHTKIFDLKEMRDDEQSQGAPSVILEINLRTGVTKKLFSNKGDIVASASVGVMIGEQLLLGTIFDNDVKACAISTKP